MIASGFSISISCLINSASPYPSIGYKNTDESVKPEDWLVLALRSIVYLSLGG
jgi:hypothetical protein